MGRSYDRLADQVEKLTEQVSSMVVNRLGSESRRSRSGYIAPDDGEYREPNVYRVFLRGGGHIDHVAHLCFDNSAKPDQKNDDLVLRRYEDDVVGNPGLHVRTYSPLHHCGFQNLGKASKFYPNRDF